jgi:hypothetical protein
MMLPLLACGAGVYLGLHFKVLALFPLSILGAAAFIFSSWASGQNFSASVVLFPLIAVQLGYMFGLTARETYGQLVGRLNLGRSERV